MCFILHLSDGQKIARRLSKQVQKSTSAVKKGLKLYNEQTISYGDSGLPLTIDIEEALDPNSDVYSELISGFHVSYE